ncbi:MAG: hypothetical protein AMXMBFR6_02000 [Betaproteobacteria bacterium]
MADALFTRSQQKVLGLLSGQADRQFHVNEMLRLTGAGKGALQRELARLETAGLVRVTQLGNQKRYQANPQAPIYEALRAIVLKTFGLAHPSCAMPCHPWRIGFGRLSFSDRSPGGADRADSDVDVLVISDALTYGDVLAALASAEARLGRKVNPAIYTPEDWQKRRKENNAFVIRVMEGAKIWLLGSDEATGRKRGGRLSSRRWTLEPLPTMGVPARAERVGGACGGHRVEHEREWKYETPKLLAAYEHLFSGESGRR